MTSLVRSEVSFQGNPILAEKISAVMVLLISTGSFWNLVISPDAILEARVEMLVMQATWSAIYLVTFALLVRHCDHFLKKILREWPLVALAVLPVVSVIWSDAPAVTFRRGVALMGTTLLGAYFAFRYEVREQLKLLGWALGVPVLFSFIFHFAGLGTPVMDIYGDAWYGVFTHKNELGRMMVLSTIVFLTLVKILPKHRWVAVGGVVLSIALVLLSSSTTSLLILMVLLLLFSLSRVRRFNPRRAAAVLAMLVLLAIGAGYWTTVNFDSALDLVGKDETLSGRTEMWAIAAVKALERPWLGYGYNAFWLGPDSPSGEISSAVGWVVSHGHNGFLDLWLDLGLLGVAVYLFGFAVYSRRAVVLLRKWHSPEALWPAVFLAYLFLSNLTESSLLAENSIFWVLYTATVLNLARECGRSAPWNLAEEEKVPSIGPDIQRYALAEFMLRKKNSR